MAKRHTSKQQQQIAAKAGTAAGQFVSSLLAPAVTPPPRRGAEVHQGQIYTFVGSIARQNNLQTTQFQVLAGDGPPTITGGYAKWVNVPRPQQTGLTIFQGYDPLTVEVPILFDNVIPSGLEGYTNTVEPAIVTLEWMAGRPLAFGVSPLVRVTSSDAQGLPCALMPFVAQRQAFIISNLAWGTDAIRDRFGNRIRQSAVVTLTAHNGAPGDIDNAAQRKKALSAQSGKYLNVPLSVANNTIRKLTVAFAHNRDPRAARTVLSANKTRLKLGSSIDQALIPRHTPGTTIRIPQSVIRPA